MNDTQIKANREYLAEYLESKGIDLSGKHIMCPNPEHNDNNPSANLYETRFNGWYVKCYSCGLHADIFELKFMIDNTPIEQVRKELGSTVSEQPKKQAITFDTIGDARQLIERDIEMEFVAIYDYYSNPKESKLVELKYFNTLKEKKIFYPFYRIDKKWIMGLPDKERPLYNWHKVEKDLKLLIVEGAKCADAFNSLNIDGWLAVSSINGAESYYRTDWSPVVNNPCYIWRDYDAAGLKYQTNLISHLRNINEDIQLWTIPIDDEWFEGYDVADFLVNLENDIYSLLDSALQVKATNALGERLDKIEDGSFSATPFYFLPTLTALAQPNVPGSWTMLCGNKGAAKSFLISEIGIDWASANENCSILFLEENEAFYQMRALGQLARNSNFTNLAWAKTNIEKVRKAFDEHDEQLEQFFKKVSYVNSRQVNYKYVTKWIEDKLTKGERNLIIDPITAAAPEHQQHIADNKFVMGVKEMLEFSGASLMTSIHPRMSTGKTSGTAQGMARSLAFENFTQNIYWLLNHETKTSIIEVGDNIGAEAEHNKTLFLEKTRHGIGQGRAIAVHLDPESLRFKERGLILYENEIKKLDKVETLEKQKF